MNIFETSAVVQRAVLFARAMHFGQKYGNHDYVDYHLMGVARIALEFCNADDIGAEKVAITAILHDVVEDTPATKIVLHDLFGEDIADAVNLLTRRNEETHDDYLQHICKPGRELALLVKKADTLFNLQNSVMANNAKRVKKYQKQLDVLNGYDD